MRLEFIKNILDVKVDGLAGVNHYTVKAMYDEIDSEGFATITYKTIDKFDMTWKEIEEKGGVGAVNKDLKERYGV